MSGQQASQYFSGEDHLAQLTFLKDLHDDDLTAYKELCELLQQNLYGIVTADSLFEELTLEGCEITYPEVEDILRNVRKDSSGHVYLVDLLKYVSSLDEDRKNRRWRHHQLFSAINVFAVKQAIRDIERIFRSKAPHVVPHYSAGVRLLALTTRQLQRRMDRMLRTKHALRNPSPYAKPFTFIHVDSQKTATKNAIGMDLQQLSKSIEKVSKIVRWANGAQQSSSQVVDVDEARVEDIAGGSEFRLSKEMVNIVRNFTELQNQLNLVAEILEDADRPRSSPCSARGRATYLKPGTKTVYNYVPPQKMVPTNNLSTGTALPGMRIRNKRKFNTGLSWTTPQLDYPNVPIPAVQLPARGKPITYTEFQRERRQIEEAKENYFQQLVEKERHNSLKHWDRIYGNTDMPRPFREHFQEIYDIYYPTRTAEIFVRCPSVSFPFKTRTPRP